MAFRFSFISDVREVLRGNEAMEKGLEDTADSLDELARAAQKAGDRAGRELDGVGSDAEDAARKLERKFREAFDDVEKKSKSAGDDVGAHVKKGADKAGEAVGEFKDEATANFSEVASSFTGDMDSAIDLVQGTLGGLAGSIPGVGLALAGVGAVAGAVAANWQESTEKTKEVVSGMYDDLIQSGEDYLSESYRQEEYWRILKGESDVIERKRVDEIAAYSKTSSEEVALAYAGDAESMQRVTDGLIAKRAEFQAQLEDETDLNDSAAAAGKKYIDGMIAANDRRTDSIIKTTDEVIRQRDYFTQMGTAAITSAEEARAKIDGLGRMIADLPASKSVKVQADFTDFDAAIRNKRPVIVGVFRAGQAVV